ncbi:MAG: hypothetical protein ACT4OK_10020 [Gemmobacter sp.]
MAVTPLLKPLALVAAMAFALPASAACYADYKASRDDPLRLHYGVMEVPDSACDRGTAEAEMRGRLRADGWKLLNVMSVFGPEGLDERKASAGEYFLRY